MGLPPLRRVAKRIDDMFYSSPEALAQLGAAVHMRHEVTAVDLKKKTLKVKDLVSGEESEDHYDKLMVTTVLAGDSNLPGLTTERLPLQELQPR